MNLAAAIVVLASSLVTVHVDTNPAHVLNVIRPDRAVGTGVDSDPKGKIALLYSPSRTKLMLSTGLGWLTYRLYTELSIEDWHWNPKGHFSDAARDEGYWTSDADPNANVITDSFGYRLPHRGSARDQGDDNDYGRIDDGDPNTYWKSNPYLTQHFTGESDSAHPQWVVIDLGRPTQIDALRIAWVAPYATHYRAEYWIGNPDSTGDGDAMLDQNDGSWHAFKDGEVVQGKGGTETLRVRAPVNPRFIRIVMDRSSNTCDSHGAADPRNCVGYAIDEIEAGTIDASGTLRDVIVHSRCGGNPGSQDCRDHQTPMYTSSTDPWHGAGDRITSDQDQPGLDLIARSALGAGLPKMYPVPLFYSTPENAAAEVRYLQTRHYPIMAIEMGEEIDGQYGTPEDYAELYIQFARAIHRVDPHLKLGGPVFSGVNKDIAAWADASGDTSWLHRFILYLERHGRTSDLAFMSFEHYPFRNCDQGETLQDDLLVEPALVRDIVSVWHADGVPAKMPLYITEANFSADGTSVPQRPEGALWMGDYVGASLAAGVAGVMYYQIEAEPLSRNHECGTLGAYNPYIVDNDFVVRAKGASFYAAQLLTNDWLEAGDREHAIFPVRTSLGEEKPLVTAYAVRRPDNTWSLLFVNKDTVDREARVSFEDGKRSLHFAGVLHRATFGQTQYRWSGASDTALPYPNRGIARSVVPATEEFRLPARSLTVFWGTVGP